MRARYLLPIVFLTGFLVCVQEKSFADRRSYVWTYEYATMPKGMREAEYWLTQDIPDTGSSNIHSWEHQLELEYGITDHWDMSLYQILKYQRFEAKSTTKYDGFKVETKYRFGQKGEFFVDPLFYFEYKREPGASQPDRAEAKLVLAKDLGNFNISYNQILERNFGRGKTEPEYAAGISYAFSPVLRLGVETKGGYSEREAAIGPAVGWAFGRYWVSLGAVFGLNSRTDDVQGRFILGAHF